MEQLLQFEGEEIALHEPPLHARKVREQVLHALRVNFNEFKVDVFPLQQVLG